MKKFNIGDKVVCRGSGHKCIICENPHPESEMWAHKPDKVWMKKDDCEYPVWNHAEDTDLVKEQYSPGDYVWHSHQDQGGTVTGLEFDENGEIDVVRLNFENGRRWRADPEYITHTTIDTVTGKINKPVDEPISIGFVAGDKVRFIAPFTGEYWSAHKERQIENKETGIITTSGSPPPPGFVTVSGNYWPVECVELFVDEPAKSAEPDCSCLNYPQHKASDCYQHGWKPGTKLYNRPAKTQEESWSQDEVCGQNQEGDIVPGTTLEVDLMILNKNKLDVNKKHTGLTRCKLDGSR